MSPRVACLVPLAPLAPLAAVGCAGGPDAAPEVTVAVPVSSGIRPLTAEVVAHDPLGRPLALDWRWEVDGAPTPWDGPRVPAHATWPGERWTVTVTATTDDGREGTAVAGATVPAPAGGNVLLVVLDDVGVDKFNAYGIAPEPLRTPVLDRLAAEGTLFTNAYASPLCSPTRAELLTGRRGRRTGVGAVLTAASGEALPEAAVLLPDALTLARAGAYTSVAVGKYHLASRRSDQGNDAPNLQGFHWYGGSMGNLLHRDDGYFRWKKTVNGEARMHRAYATTDTVDDALARMAAIPEPWFVLVAFNAPHEPFHVPPRELTTVDVADGDPDPELYAAMLEAVDTELGRLLKAVDLSATTVVVMGDNGTPAQAVVAPLHTDRAKHTVYEGGVRVPLVVAGRHVAVPGSRSDALVHAVDVFATVADLAGVPLGARDGGGWTLDLGPDGERALDGISLLPWLADPGRPSMRETVVAEWFSPIGPPPYESEHQTIRDARYKLVRGVEDGEERFELYDLRRSPVDEGEDLLPGGLAPEAQAAFDRLSAALAAELAALPYDGF